MKPVFSGPALFVTTLFVALPIVLPASAAHAQQRPLQAQILPQPQAQVQTQPQAQVQTQVPAQVPAQVSAQVQSQAQTQVQAPAPRRHLAPHARVLPVKHHRPPRPHVEMAPAEARAMPHLVPPPDAPKPDATIAAMQDAAAPREETSPAKPDQQQAAAQPQAIPPEIQQFCSNNAAVAGQVRIAWEAAKLKELETKLRQRISELEAKRAEYEDWLHKREDALKKATENIVAIYTRMRPEAAALQLAAMDDDMAAAVLIKLKPANASAILNEMEPGRAARLTATMVGSNTPADGKKT